MTDLDRYKIEAKEKWRDWAGKIPAIEFDPAWEVRVIPPLGGAMARFKVEVGDKLVSVYLDCFDALGSYGSPYCEVYPYDDDVGRCDIGDTDELLKMIRHALSP